MIVLYNPLSTTPGKQPLPLSVMALAAVLERPAIDRQAEAWTLVDGNVVPDPAAEIIARLSAAPPSPATLLAVTVMPGPQLTQAVAVCRRVKEALPHVPIVWGGYFPTQHSDTVLRAPYVDFVIRSQGERALLQLVDVLRSGGVLNGVGGLSWKGRSHRSASDGARAFQASGALAAQTGRRESRDGPDERDAQIVHNPVQPLTTLDELPDLPYHRVDMERYLHPNYLGRRTVAHNSSF